MNMRRKTNENLLQTAFWQSLMLVVV